MPYNITLDWEELVLSFCIRNTIRTMEKLEQINLLIQIYQKRQRPKNNKKDRDYEIHNIKK